MEKQKFDPSFFDVMRPMRDTVKLILGNRYRASVQPFIKIVQLVMKHNKESALEALARISETEMYTSSPSAQIMFHAAAVELTEPIKPQP